MRCTDNEVLTASPRRTIACTTLTRVGRYPTEVPGPFRQWHIGGGDGSAPGFTCTHFAEAIDPCLTLQETSRRTLPDIALVFVVTLIFASLVFLLGFAFAVGLAWHEQSQYPDDASAGSVAAIAIATTSFGGLFGETYQLRRGSLGS